MKILQSEWVSFACCCLNAFFAFHCYLSASWGMFVLCSVFTVGCGYNFWNRMGEE